MWIWKVNASELNPSTRTHVQLDMGHYKTSVTDTCFISSAVINLSTVTVLDRPFTVPLVPNLYISGSTCSSQCSKSNFTRIYRVIKKSLCTWWLQYRKLQVMFKVSPASLQTFTDTPNCVLEDRVQYSTVHIPNVFCDGHLHLINCVGIVRMHWVFVL